MTKAIWCTLVLAAIMIAGCQGTTTPIKTLLDDPSQYDGKTVRIMGTVEQGVGLLGYGTYKVNDGTGTLWVVSKAGGAPRSGAKTGVEGEFRSAFTLGDQTAAVLMEKSRYTP